MFVMVVIILALCENADSYNNIQFSITRTEDGNKIVYACSQNSAIYTMLEGQTAHLGLRVPDTLSKGWCQHKNANDIFVNSFNDTYDRSYTETIWEAEIANVNYTLGTQWKCIFAVKNNDVRPTCEFKVHVRKETGPVLRINGTEIITSRSDVSFTEYDFFGFYGIDGLDAVLVVCSVDDKQGIKIQYYNNQMKSDPYRDFAGFEYISEIEKKVNLLDEYTNNSYVECCHRTAEDLTVVRVFFTKYKTVSNVPMGNPSRNSSTKIGRPRPRGPGNKPNTSTVNNVSMGNPSRNSSAKVPSPKPNTRTGDSQAKYYIVISCGACVMIVIIMIIIYWKFKNNKRRFNDTNHACYVNVPENESSIRPIPSKYNEYSEPLNNNDNNAETYAVIDNTGCMYAKPLPKCQRIVKASEYSNTHENLVGRAHMKGHAKVSVEEVVAYAEVGARLENGGKNYANVCNSDQYVNAEGNEYAEPAYSLPVIKD